MDIAKAQQVLVENNKKKNAFSRLQEKVGSLLLPLLSLQSKLILPYLFLTLVIASLGVFVVTSLTVDSERERLNNRILEASRVANDGIVSYEKNQLERLRFLVFAEGMARSIFDRNADQIFNLMRPVLASSRVNLITALDTNGQEIVTFGRETGAKEYHLQNEEDFSGVTSIGKILNGSVDDQGDKFAELLILEQGPILFTSAPVRDANQKLVGVMLVGTYLQDILVDLKQQAVADNIIVLDENGKLIGTTLTGDVEGFADLIERLACHPVQLADSA